MPKFQSLIIYILALCLVALWPACKPTPQFEILKTITDQKWEVAQLELAFEYEFEEKYTVPSTGNFRLVKQEGKFGISYHSDFKKWTINGDYLREEESVNGPFASTTIQFDTAYNGIVGVWEFNSDATNAPTGLSQRYYNENQNCDEFAYHTGNWSLKSQEDQDGLYVTPLINFDLAHLYPGHVAGGLVWSPHIFDGSRFLNGLCEIEYNENSSLLEIDYHYLYDTPLRDTSFSDPNYGDVEIRERRRDVVIWVVLKKVDKLPCEPTSGCAPGSIPCVHGTVLENVEGICTCQCETGWEGPACDQKKLLATSVSLVAGNGNAGLADSAALLAEFNQPFDISADSEGNLFVADWKNHAIRMFRKSDNQVITVAGGNGVGHVDGPAAQAAFRGPTGLTVAPDGTIYICDNANHCIRKISTDGTVSTLAGQPTQSGYQSGPFASAAFTSPSRIIYDAGILRGHPVLLMSEAGNSIIWLLDLNSQEAEVYAGTPFGGRYTNGPAAQASFAGPTGMVLAANGTLFVADRGHHAIRTVANNEERTVDTYSGNMPDGRTISIPANLPYSYPTGLAFGPDSSLYISDERNHRIRRIRLINGLPLDEAIAGDAMTNQPGNANGQPSAARFNEPDGMVFVGNTLYVIDNKNHQIRSVGFE